VTQVRYIAETVVAKMAEMAGRVGTELEFGESDRGWVGDVAYTHLDGAKFHQLGWRAKYSSDQAVELAIKEIIAERSSEFGVAKGR